MIGAFNTWDGRRHPMRLRHDCSVWEIFIPRLGAGELYKYEILGADGRLTERADPLWRAADRRRPRLRSSPTPSRSHGPLRRGWARAQAGGTMRRSRSTRCTRLPGDASRRAGFLVAGTGRHACSLHVRPRLHACRAPAGDAASVRRLLSTLLSAPRGVSALDGLSKARRTPSRPRPVLSSTSVDV